MIGIDFETRSPVDLKTRGAYVYFEHPEARVLIGSYQIGNDPVARWGLDQPCPPDLARAIEAGAMITAHNAAFEMLCFDWLHKRAGWPMPRYEQFRCTAATAAAMALPRALGDLGEALGLSIQKDKEGARLMRMFSIADKHGQFKRPEDHPAEWEAYKRYCDFDVLTEAEADSRLVPLSDFEQQVWQLSERINRRGVRIDRTSARAAIRLADKAKKVLDAEMRATTGGAVTACTQVQKLAVWLKDQGVHASEDVLAGSDPEDATTDDEDLSMAKASIEDYLARPNLPAHARHALELRLEASKASVKKLNAMLKRANADGRVRGAFIYHQASTGRWQSTGVNFANLPRPRRIYDEAKPRADVLFQAFRAEDPALLKDLYGPDLGRPLHLVSDAIRGFIWSAPEHDLVQADYSGIEGAVIAWLANEEWKLAEMHAIIADPARPDLYRQTAAGIMNTTTDVVTKKHPLRQSVGKTSELACFGPTTRVITSNGVKFIRDVTVDDRLWDGEEWVTHQGVIAKGVRPIVDVDGIAITPDHMVLVNGSWKLASELAFDANMLSRALATGSGAWSSLVLKTGLPAGCQRSSSNAIADGLLTGRHSTFCSTDAQLNAVFAGEQRRLTRESPISGMTTLCQTRRTDDAFSIASLPASVVAQTPKIRLSPTMAGVVFPYSGAGTGERSSLTLSPWKVGTTRLWTWTASTSMEIMRRAISASSRAARTASTSEKWPTRNAKSQNCVPVFDILNAGPRHRFTILSDNGAFVVHNCGFQGGVSAFYTMARGYSVDLDALHGPVKERADEATYAKAVKRYENALKRKMSRADLLSREAWIACEIIKNGWRAQNAAIAKSWKDAESAVREAVQNPGTVTEAARCKFIVRLGFLWTQLPSGRCLAYGGPKLRDQVWAEVRCDDGSFSDAEVMDREEAEAKERKGLVRIQGATSAKVTFLGVDSTTKKWRRQALYGGLIMQNNTQATARDLLVNGMLKAEAAGYPVIAHVYDEMICEVPKGFGDLKAFERLICELPEWAAGMPLTAGGWRGKRYRKD